MKDLRRDEGAQRVERRAARAKDAARPVVKGKGRAIVPTAPIGP
jgi:hypothetical protein